MLPPESWSSRRSDDASLSPADASPSLQLGSLPLDVEVQLSLAAGGSPQRRVLPDGESWYDELPQRVTRDRHDAGGPEGARIAGRDDLAGEGQLAAAWPPPCR